MYSHSIIIQYIYRRKSKRRLKKEDKRKDNTENYYRTRFELGNSTFTRSRHHMNFGYFILNRTV